MSDLIVGVSAFRSGMLNLIVADRVTSG